MTCTWIESGGSSCSHRPQSGVKTARFPPDHLDACCSPRPSSPRCMTASTDWPRIGPAVYCATTQEDELRREENPQVDKHLKASPQVAESAPGTLSRWRHGFEPRWDYKQRCRSEGMFRLSSQSAGPFVPHLSRGRPRHVTTEPAQTRVRVVSVADFFVFRRRLALPRS